VLIDWTGEFDQWLDRLTGQAAAGGERAIEQAARVDAAFRVLEALTAVPVQDSPTLRRVRQSGRNVVWRVAHPFTPGVAVRLIVWFPPERPGEVVVVLFGADKAAMGDVFYDSAGTRADAAINRYRLET
jgi:hypothetical protein